jgi:hypothetical protein
MGRPLKPKYFGKYDAGGVGGEYLLYANVTALGTNYYAGNTTVTFSAPQIPGGTTATGTAVIAANNTVTAITITNAGSGYTSAPTANVNGPSFIVRPTISSTLSGYQQNAIKVYANVSGVAGATTQIGEIVKQTGTRRYRVQTANGTSTCTLVSGTPISQGQASLYATDVLGNYYYVTKLTDRTATLIQGNTGRQFANNSHVSWNLTTAVANVSVIIDNN